MPAPKMPTAKPRRSRREPGADERHADRERGTGDAQEETADQQRGQAGMSDQAQEQHRHDRQRTTPPETSPARRTGRSARRPGSGPASRRSPAPRRAGPAENEVRCSESFSRGPSGLSSAHAQKLTANPTVASASISQARRDTATAARSAAGPVGAGTPVRAPSPAVLIETVSFLDHCSFGDQVRVTSLRWLMRTAGRRAVTRSECGHQRSAGPGGAYRQRWMSRVCCAAGDGPSPRCARPALWHGLRP